MPGGWATRSVAWKSSLIFTDEAGFTLVETLVAAVILFTCLAAASLSYNTAAGLAGRLDATVEIATEAASIRDSVTESLFAGRTEGVARYAENIEYAWLAEEKRSSRTVTGGFDELTGEIQYGRFHVTLYSVELVVTLERYGRRHNARYEYHELVWREQ